MENTRKTTDPLHYKATKLATITSFLVPINYFFLYLKFTIEIKDITQNKCKRELGSLGLIYIECPKNLSKSFEA